MGYRNTNKDIPEYVGEHKLQYFLQSSDNYDVEITQEILKNLEEIAIFIDYINVICVEKFGVVADLHHCYRDKKTTRRLQKEGVGASSTSQHHYGEAMDIHFYTQSGERLYNRNLFQQVGVYIYNMTGILRVRVYNWGVHVGIETKRTKARGMKKKMWVQK